MKWRTTSNCPTSGSPVSVKDANSGSNSAAEQKLTSDIDDLVDLRIQSSEGALVYPGRLRAWLSAISGQVSMALVPPTPAMIQVADGYIQQAAAGVARLKADMPQ